MARSLKALAPAALIAAALSPAAPGKSEAAPVAELPACPAAAEPGIGLATGSAPGGAVAVATGTDTSGKIVTGVATGTDTAGKIVTGVATGTDTAGKIVTGIATGTDTAGKIVTGVATGTETAGKIVTGVATGTDTASKIVTGVAAGTDTAGIAIAEEGGPNQHADRPKPEGTALTARGSGAGAEPAAAAQARHAIRTKGTGTSGRTALACRPQAGVTEESKSNMSTN